MPSPEQLSRFSAHLGPQEACGVTAIVSKTGKDITPTIPLMQYELHHRGRDSAGMVAFDQRTGVLTVYTGIGSTGEVFNIVKDKATGEMETKFDFASRNLLSDRGIGHNRYGTSGNEHKDSDDGAQPMLAEWNGRSVAVAFNGNIPDTEREKLHARLPEGMEPGMFDTEDIVRAIATADGDTWEERIVNGMDGIKGAYSLTILADDGNVYGLRGPSGTWPLWLGETDDRVVLSSESVVDPSLLWTEVNAGELVKINKSGVEKQQVYVSEEARCVLHDVYGAHPESKMTLVETYRQFRERIGKQLAKEYPIEADIYAGVPNTGTQIATGYTKELGKPLTSIFRKLTNEERSYIAQNPEAAENVIKGKFKIAEEILKNDVLRGKRIVLIDDSIIKGSTSRIINEILLNAGAESIDWISGTSQFEDNCDQGYVVQKKLLVGLENLGDGDYRKRTTKEIAQIIRARSVNYISEEGLRKTYGPEQNPCLACMGGEHPFHRINPVTVYDRSTPHVDKDLEVDTMIAAAAD